MFTQNIGTSSWCGNFQIWEHD